jgi:MFS family permease
MIPGLRSPSRWDLPADTPRTARWSPRAGGAGAGRRRRPQPTTSGRWTLGRLLCGVGFVVTTIFFTKMVVDWFAGRELATAMAVLAAMVFGIAMGQVGHSWLAATYGWRMLFIAAALYRRRARCC